MDSNGLGIFLFPRDSVSRLAAATFSLAVVTLLGFAGGCTLAPDCDLEDYGAYGGRWQRTLRNSGRVGSVFDPAGAQLPYDGPNAPTEGVDRFPDDDAEDDRDAQAAGDGDDEIRDSDENRKDAPTTSEPSPNDAPLVPPTELETDSPSTADQDRTARRGGLKSVLEPSGPSVR